MDIDFVGDSFLWSLSFEGKGAQNNNFLKSFNTEFINHSESRVYSEIVTKRAIDYKNYIDKIHRSKWNFYHTYDKNSRETFTNEFSRYIIGEIDYWWAYSLLRYHWEHPASNGLSYPMKIIPSYYNFLGKILVSNDYAVRSRNYLNFLVLYLKLREDNPEAAILNQIDQSVFEVRVSELDVYVSSSNRTALTKLYRGERIKYLNLKSKTLTTMTVSGLTSSDYWYQVRTKDGRVGWVFGGGGKIVGDRKGKKEYKNIEVEEEVTKTVAIGLVDRLRVRENPDMPSAIALVNEGEQMTYLGNKSQKKQTFTIRGNSTTDYFYNVQTPSGQIGWVFGGAIEIKKMISKRKVKKTISIEGKRKDVEQSQLYLSGRALYYTMANTVFWKCKNSKPSEMEREVNDFIAKCPYPEMDAVIKKAYDEAVLREYDDSSKETKIANQEPKKEEPIVRKDSEIKPNTNEQENLIAANTQTNETEEIEIKTQEKKPKKQKVKKEKSKKNKNEGVEKTNTKETKIKKEPIKQQKQKKEKPKKEKKDENISTEKVESKEVPNSEVPKKQKEKKQKPKLEAKEKKDTSGSEVEKPKKQKTKKEKPVKTKKQKTKIDPVEKEEVASDLFPAPNSAREPARMNGSLDADLVAELDLIALGYTPEEAKKVVAKRKKQAKERANPTSKPQPTNQETKNTSSSNVITPAQLLSLIDLTPINRVSHKVKISGKIQNHRNKNTQIILYKDPVSMEEVEFNIYVKPDGSFSTALQIFEPTIGKFIYGSRNAEIYLEPGDELNIDFSAYDFRKSLKFEGKGSVHNQFIQTLRNEFKNEDTESKGKIYSASASGFKQFVKEIHKKKLKFLDQNRKGFSYDFDQYIQSDVNYWYAYNLTNYRWENPLQYGNSKPLTIRDINYYDFVDQIGLVQEGALPNEFYTYFIDLYLKDKSEEPGNKGLTDIELSSQYLYGEVMYFYQAKRLTAMARNGKLADVLFDIKRFMDECPYESYRESMKQALRESNTLLKGMDAPDFELLNEKGHKVKLSDYKGKVIYLDFWATWCNACIRQMTNSDNLKNTFKNKDVVFIYISLDYTESEWKNYVRRHTVPGIHLYAKGAYGSDVAKDYGVKKLPALFIIDKNGVVQRNTEKMSSNLSIMDQIQTLLYKK